MAVEVNYAVPIARCVEFMMPAQPPNQETIKVCRVRLRVTCRMCFSFGNQAGDETCLNLPLKQKPTQKTISGHELAD